MTDDDVEARITIERAAPGTVPFRPGEEVRVLVEFEPEDVPGPYILPGQEGLWPQTPYYDLLPDYVPYEEPWVLDIETTGLAPYESRIVCIGMKSLRDREREPILLLDVNEEQMLHDFARWMKALNPSALVGWGLGFDYKFLFQKLAAHRVKCPVLQEVKFQDLANVYRTGMEKYIYSIQKLDKLDNIARALLGRGKTMSARDVLEAWLAGEHDKIKAFNRQDLELIADLWLLAQYVQGKGELPEELVPRPGTVESHTMEKTTVNCPICMTEWSVPVGTEPGNCPVCGVRYGGFS